jgi:hypothetical protein
MFADWYGSTISDMALPLLITANEYVVYLFEIELSNHKWDNKFNDNVFLKCLKRVVQAGLGFSFVFNATFNNISVLSWRSVLLVEETREPGENHRSVASHWKTWSNYELCK